MRIAHIAAVALLLATPLLAQEEAPYDPFSDIVVSDDASALPEAVAAKRQALIAATMSGDIEALGAVMDAQDYPPNVSFGGPDDALAYLKDQSADPEGRQILALLRNLLEMPYAVLGAGSETPSYVWPYLAVIDIAALEPGQVVDAYRLITPEQLDDMHDFGGWFWWRVYIGADGEWQAFVAGD
ncbi:MAG: hypothetical protein KIT02_17095 [Devosia sp.]|uniref:hypothetical protein n=1 Tax=Devosia sp. TaxID=1871048 RepID=UPI0024C5ED4B|nr:hypothetical protein [Devosia sp.]UYN99596.1 MAG: hypothetical protein KIT02_17095 [Devosia sp.]